uniref:Cadherin domain-containing protein n=1 Tax=Steinernema glaseri TaxID=37863 RepID=A0A1I7Z9B9_9BILA
MSSPSTFFFGKSVSVKFQSCPIPLTFLEENGDLKIGVSYLDLSTFTDKNTVISLDASKPSMFYNTVNLKEQFASVTFTLSSQKDGTKLQLYPLQIQSPNSPTSIVIIDGDLHSPAAVTSLQALVPISSYSGHTTPVNPFISTTGSITVLLLSTPDSTQSPKDLNEFFIKVYDDSKDCDESNSVYYVDLSVQHFVESKSTKLDRCPLTLIKQRNADPNSVVTIGVNNVDGTDKDVKVLPGSSDLDVTPFYEFNQKNQAKWANFFTNSTRRTRQSGPTSCY